MSLAACAALVEKGDPERFAATMAAPAPARARLWPLYAYNLELARAPWVTREPMIAEMRLQWWADLAEAVGQGEPPRAHEVAGPLAELVRAQGLPWRLLSDMAEARRWDVWSEPFADVDALWAYLDATAGSLAWASALALGAGPGAEAAVRDAGVAGGLAGFLRAVPELMARGRRPLPDASEAAVTALALEGLARLARARGARATVGQAAAPALFPVWSAGAVLKQAASEPGRVAAGALAPSEFARRRALMLRAFTGRW